MRTRLITLYMGYNPTEKRIIEEIKKIIMAGKIKKLELNLNRNIISYEYEES